MKKRTNKKKYLAFFRIRFTNGLQYRAAAYAGIVTQFAWGFMMILMFHAFYRSDPSSVPMELSSLTSYLWLQQAFLALFMTWFWENDIFEAISSGGIAYEMCRPVNLYDMWFTRSMASRLSKAVLRCFPILIVAFFLPEGYRLSLPAIQVVPLFLISMALGFLVVVAFCMLIYIVTFYTISPLGIRTIALSLIEFLSGGIIPLPFLPDKLRSILELLPFASMQNVPLRIYCGDLAGRDALISVGLQLFWAVSLIWAGRKLMNRVTRQAVVQGG